MKTIAKLSIALDRTTPEIFSELCNVYPKGKQGVGLFQLQLSLDTSTVFHILDIFHKHGLEPWNEFDTTQEYNRTFDLDLQREYSEADYRAAKFLRPVPTVSFDSGRTQDGMIMLVSQASAGGIRPNVDIADATIGNGVVVSDRLRTRMEQAGFQNIVFRETTTNKLPKPPLPGPYWQLWSDLILSPLSPRMFLFGEKDQPYERIAFDGDYEKNWFPREGEFPPDVLFFPPELRYEPGVLEALPSFDLALTRELIGMNSRRFLVASQRFYQFCAAEKLPMRWLPVRTDPTDPPPVKISAA